MAIKYIDDIDVNGKKVFIRADFNVPLDENQNITNDNRITATIPTIKYVLDNGGAIICASHLGRRDSRTLPEWAAARSRRPSAGCGPPDDYACVSSSPVSGANVTGFHPPERAGPSVRAGH